MMKAEAEHTTLIEKGVPAMWEDFEPSHQKLLVDIINQIKNRIFLSAEDIEIIRARVRDKLSPLIEDMSQGFADYRSSLMRHMGAIMKDQIKQMIDTKLSDVGFLGDDKNPDLLEPVSKTKNIMLKLEKMNDEFLK